MCLAKIDECFTPICEADGYKVFLKNSKGQYVPEFYSPDSACRYRFWMHSADQRTPIPTNVELKAAKNVIETDEGTFYRSGFHAFEDKESAKKWINDTFNPTDPPKYIVKVKLRNIKTRGAQRAFGWKTSLTCLVAEKMIVPEPTCGETPYVPC